MVTLTYGLKETKHATIEEAFRVLYARVKEQSPLSESFLSTIWVNHDGVRLFFPQIRDLAYEKNWLSEEGRILI